MAFNYKRIYLGVGATVVALFSLLLFIGVEITDKSGDVKCAGTLSNPCLSLLTIYNPTPKNIFIYNKEEVRIGFSPAIKDYSFYVKDGRCSGKLTGSSCSCYLQSGEELAFKGWRCVDFTNRTKPKQDAAYVYRWSAYSKQEHMIAGFKFNPSDEIKWGVELAGEILDPKWLSAYTEYCQNKTVEVAIKVQKMERVTCYKNNETCWDGDTKSVMVDSIEYVNKEVCDYVNRIKITIGGIAKEVLCKENGCIINGDKLTLIKRGDGYSINRGKAYLDKCLPGEKCVQYNITTGEKIRDSGDGIVI